MIMMILGVSKTRKQHVLLPLCMFLLCLIVGSVVWGSTLAGRMQERAGNKQKEEWSIARVHALITEKNLAYKNEAQCVVESGKLIALDLSAASLTDFSFLKSMKTLGVLDLRGTSIRNLSVIRGLPLTVLGCEDTGISNLEPLEGMKLEKLYLNNTKVEDLSHLSGMPLKLLNLFGTAVEDLRPIATLAQLELLWLNWTQVTDISPLSKCPLVSLTLHKTPVEDLNPLSKVKTLQRLHIAESGVSDLTPIRDLELVRLVFTPSHIEEGLEIVRNMKSIQEIGVKLDSLLPPTMFWSLYDQGMYD